MKVNIGSQAIRSARQAEALLGQLREGLFQTDLDHLIVYCNEYAARLANFDSAEQMLEAKLRSVDLFADPEDQSRLVQNVLLHGAVESFVCRMRSPRGVERWIQISVFLALDDHEQHVGYWGILRDLTEQMETRQARDRLQQELVEALKRLEQSERLVRQQRDEILSRNRRLQEFHAAVIHDLKAPLNSLIGFIDMLFEREAAADDKTRHCLERMRFNVLQMDRIVQGFQELILLDREAERRMPVDPAQVMRTVLQNRRDQIGRCAVTVEIQDNLPAVEVQPTKLYQLLDNLLSNALKALSEKPDGRVFFGRGCESDPTAFFVEDNGPGIPASEREKVFAPFYRADRSTPGSGLGLTIVRRIVEMYGGRVWIEAGADGGTRVCFSLPRAAL
jgi:PAS domain S-box-containing protein